MRPNRNTAVRRRVLIVGIDGCRPDALRAAKTPSLCALIRDGAVSYQAQTCEFTVSGPGWASMLTGVWPSGHHVEDNSFDGARFDLYPHFFQRLKEVRAEIVTASIVNWGPINHQILSASDISAEYDRDFEVAEAAEQLLTSHDPDVLFLHFDEVDQAGHAHGFGPHSAKYLEAISMVDAQIGDILAALRRRTTYDRENWLVLVSTDHGGSGRKHGENLPDHRTIFMILSGPTIPPGLIHPPPQIVDVPPTAFSYLDLKIDPSWNWAGRPLVAEARHPTS